ncbi:MAG: cellulase family glycosylhydrolase [Mediterranea sp.]|jgi:aryl-phospho-beta-D-glucosidase BglC (GH1 family)|nr:cellulase family glycosylhydrolase [Mediterranea sp.]
MKPFNLPSIAFLALFLLMPLSACSDNGKEEDGKETALTLSPESFTFPAEGGTATLTVSSSLRIRLSSDADWCTATTGSAQGTAQTQVYTVTASANAAYQARTATLTVSAGSESKQVTVSQAAAEEPVVPDTPSDQLPPDATGMESDAATLVARMTRGWNLGNTLEATGGETAWGNPLTTAEMIKKVKEAGFNAIRIPCSWNQYLEADAAPYTIKPTWMSRVKEVVDYCVDNGLYAILNIHWDGGWLETSIPNGYSETVNEKQRSLWKQIAIAFRDYDEHLLFAGCNEPNVENAAQMTTLLRYEQTFVDAVRGTGGRNAYRSLIVQGPSTDIDKTLQLMTTLPTDPATKRLILEVHYYTPWTFAGLEKDESWGKMAYFWGEDNQGYAQGAYAGRWDNTGGETAMRNQLEKMKTTFIDKGIPVILGEYGALRRTLSDSSNSTENAEAQKGHDASRAAYIGYATHQAQAYGMAPFFWDAGNSMSLFKRPEMTVIDPGVYEAMMK